MRLTCRLREGWARTLIQAIAAVGSERVESFLDFKVKVDSGGQLLLDTADSAGPVKWNPRYARTLSREQVIWSLSSSMNAVARREFLAQYWLADKIYRILTHGKSAYRGDDPNTLKWFYDSAVKPTYREPAGLDPRVADILRDMLAFTKDRKYRSLAQAVEVLKGALSGVQLEPAA